MQAGLLREFLTFKEPIEVETDSGFTKKEYIKVLTTRAYKKKKTGNEVEQTHEIINTAKLTFLLRYNPKIKETHVVSYNGRDYTIDFLDENKRDKTIELRVKRKDE